MGCRGFIRGGEVAGEGRQTGSSRVRLGRAPLGCHGIPMFAAMTVLYFVLLVLGLD